MSLVARLVDVGPNNEPNNGNNVEPRAVATFSRSFYEFLLAHIALALLLQNHSRGKIAALDEEAAAAGREGAFLLLCADNSSYTRYLGGGLPDEILEESPSVGRETESERSLHSPTLATLRVVLDPREKRRSTVAALVPQLSPKDILSDASSAYRLDSISLAGVRIQNQTLTKERARRMRPGNCGPTAVVRFPNIDSRDAFVRHATEWGISSYKRRIRSLH